MKPRYKNVMTMFGVAVLAIGLAACGGSSKKADPVDPPEMPDPAIAERAAIASKIMAAQTAVNAVDNDSTDAQVTAADNAVAAARSAIAAATNVPAAERTANTGTVNAIVVQLASAKMARTTAMNKADMDERTAMADKGKALKKALTDTPLSLIGTDGASLDAMLTIDADANAGIAADPVLKAGDSAGSLGGWSGTNYSQMSGTGASKVTNTAVVYTNRDAPKDVAWTSTEGTAVHGLAETAADSGMYTVTATASPNIKGSMFPTVGTETFKPAAPGNDVVITGTYAGAPGKYLCQGTNCAAAYSSAGITLSGGGGWTFTPNEGAMVAMVDPGYLYFGWWLRESADGPTHASAFHGNVGVDNAALDLTVTGLRGDATYTGKAAGKFAYYNPLDKSGDAGHFTADAKLMATFGGASTTTNESGVTGTINNFMANGQSVPWSVKLNRAGLGAASGAISGNPDTTATDDAATTVWSINGNSADASGQWSGAMYDEDAEDGSNVPTSATGVFESMFGSTHTMVGAFGVEKDDN